MLVPLQLTAADLSTDGSGARASVFSNEDLNDVMKIVKSFEESRFLIKGVSKTVKNEVEEQKGGFLSFLAASLGASKSWNILLWSILLGKGVITASEGAIRAGEWQNV